MLAGRLAVIGRTSRGAMRHNLGMRMATRRV
jgi:hypothetical protein